MENILQLERELSNVKSAQSGQAEQIRTIFNRMDKQDKMISTMNDLALSVRDLKNGQTDMGKRIDKMGGVLEEIQQKPAKRWEAIVEKLIMTVLTAVAAYFIGRIGL